jgi:hypothetical protein
MINRQLKIPIVNPVILIAANALCLLINLIEAIISLVNIGRCVSELI